MARQSSPWAAARMDAIIPFVVVLPLLPVTAITGRSKRARQPAARSPSARRVSSTAIDGTVAAPRRTFDDHGARTARDDVVDERVSVEVLAFQRDEQRTVRHVTAVGRDRVTRSACRSAIAPGPARSPPTQRRHFAQAQHARGSSGWPSRALRRRSRRSASVATATSENG